MSALFATDPNVSMVHGVAEKISLSNRANHKNTWKKLLSMIINDDGLRTQNQKITATVHKGVNYEIVKTTTKAYYQRRA